MLRPTNLASTVLTLPKYFDVPAEICSLIMKVSAATQPPDTESAELFMMSLADCVEAAQVTIGATTVVPLNDIAEDKSFDITHISSVSHAYTQLKFAPGKIMTYGTVVCYSPEATSHFLGIGSLRFFSSLKETYCHQSRTSKKVLAKVIPRSTLKGHAVVFQLTMATRQWLYKVRRRLWISLI